MKLINRRFNYVKRLFLSHMVN